MNSFYITLPSNVSSFEYYPNNTAANYVTQLARPLELDDSWEVAVTEVSYTVSWYNVRGDYEYFIINENNEKISDTFFLNAGYYPYIETIIENMNKELKYLESNYINPPKLIVDRRSRRISIEFGRITSPYESLLFLKLPDELFAQLGFVQKTWQKIAIVIVPINNESDDHNTVRGEIPYDLTGGIHSILLYSDVVQPSLVGDSYTQLLRVIKIPNDVDYGDQAVISYAHPYYLPLMNTRLSTIEIDLKDDTGHQFPFEYGRTIVTMHFRKKII